MSTFQQYNVYAGLTPVRLVANSNQSGTYYNGPINNGVGATFTYATGALTIDSVTVNVGDRILFAAQSSAFQNGIYVCQVAGSTGVSAVLQRSADMQSIEQYKDGQFVTVGAGSVYGGDSFTLIEPLPAQLGISNMSWSNASSTGSVTFSGGPSVANNIPVFSDTAGNIAPQTVAATLGFGLTLSTGNFAASQGNVTAGSSGHAGFFTSFPGTAANGSFVFKAVNNASNFASTLSNAAVGQATVYTLPDPGAATANVLLDAGTGAAISVNKLSYGATPVSQVDPGSCTIVGAAGASNVCNVTIQLKDGGGNNIAYISPFSIYASSASNGLTLASAASTGFAVSSGGLSLANGTAVTTQIRGMTSATGGCVLTLTDTGKQTSYLVLVLHNGIKISAQLSSGSYGA
jgi:hypothetical protein